VPHVLNFEDHLNWHRFYDKLTAEAVMNLKIFPYYKFFHPQREDIYDSIIYDAEFKADIYKRLNEQRHQVALKCVQLGIYKDIYEANNDQR
jgi:hypothetical protein